ncbi:putative ribonuclease H-like domain-containing protein, partial [Tanacetum coccineum]
SLESANLALRCQDLCESALKSFEVLEKWSGLGFGLPALFGLILLYFKIGVKGVALDNLLVQQKKCYANNTNRDSTVSPSVSTAGQSFTNADDLPTDSLMPDLEKDERGIVVRNKARLVAQGSTQEEDIDYDGVFAYVARIEAIKLFLAYASFKGFIVYQMDVKSAFLYGTIEEEVYVCQPPGFEDLQFLDKVYKVEKALYGLHQAPIAWYETLSTYWKMDLEEALLIRLYSSRRKKVISC